MHFITALQTSSDQMYKMISLLLQLLINNDKSVCNMQ